MPHRVSIVALVLAMFSAPLTVCAEDLRVESVETGAWHDTVTALQHDPASEGRVVHLVVRHGQGFLVPCDMYAIELDGVARAAFTSLGCDRRGYVTTLRLTHREALFAPGEPVAWPRRVELTVVLSSVSTTITGGGTAPTGRDVSCSVRVRPYLDDLARGGRVYLTPGPYALRVLRSR